jgi:DNA-binding NtrC family response regulator
MDTDRKTLEQVAVDDRNEFDDRSSLGTVLIVSGDEAWAISMGKILNDNLYGTSVPSNGDQIIERLEGAWHHIILIDLDSIDIPEDHLARNIRKWSRMYL